MSDNLETLLTSNINYSDPAADLHPSGYDQMLAISKSAAKLEGRIYHPVPSLHIRRQLADSIQEILEECQEMTDGCLICRDLHPCVKFWDSHYTHRMEEE